MITNFTSFKSLFSHRLFKALKYNFLFILLFMLTLQAGAHNMSSNPALENRLPVFTTELAVSTSGQNLVISWQADKEAFNYYEVEKSTDAIHYSTIGLVLDAPENSNICLFKDKKTTGSNGKTVWYRIKAIDKNAVVSYSGSVSYVVEQPTVNCESEAFPNPFTDATSIRFKSNEAGFATILVQNLDGQTLLSKQSHISMGYNSIYLDGLTSLSKGIYVARITINGTVAGNQKLTKK
jgi:hypothetical protein